MSTIGVGSTLNERWAEGQPECGEDYCSTCEMCLGCDIKDKAGCPDDGVSGFHAWANEEGEVRLV